MSRKVMVCGDVGGNLAELFKRVETVQKKNGVFDMLICAGEFFGSQDVGGEEDQQPNYVDVNPLKDYASGAKKAPCKTYFVCGKEWGPSLDQTAPDLKEVAPDIFFLGVAGICEIDGLRVAFMSGAFPFAAAGSLELMQANKLVGLHALDRPVDVLVTVQWPSSVHTQLHGAPAPDLPEGSKVGTSAVSMVAKRLCPRYHFAGSQGLFFERPPYLNPPANNKPGTTKHVTRFIGLAPVGALDKKNRWIYAANITPVANMSAEKLNEIPPGVTHSPFKPPPMAFQSAGGLSTVGAGAAEQGLSKTICHVANLPFNIREDSLLFSFANCGEVVRVHIAKDGQTGKPRGFAFVEFKTAEGALKAVQSTGMDVGGRQVRVSLAPERDGSGLKRGAPGGEGGGHGGPPRKRMETHPLMMRSADCWFCLSSPKVEKHLVVSIGEEVYVALAKGPLIPEHVLILPITHYPAGSQLPDNVWDEVEKYKESLTRCFKEKLGKGLVFYERATAVKSIQSHCHIQAVPVPLDREEGFADHIRGCGARLNMEFEPRPDWREDDGLQREQYVIFESSVPRSTLLHLVPQGHRHPLNFAREVVARLLDMPERADWKNCALSLEEEEEMAKSFKTLFAPFDWSLLED